MCYAILSVSCRNDKDRKTYECDSLGHMNTKISELQALPQTSQISVFLCNQVIELVQEWKARPYQQQPTETKDSK